MKLTDLNPQWLGNGGEGITRNGEPVPYRPGVSLMFDCPCGKCGMPCAIPMNNPLDGGPPLNPDHGWDRIGEDFETLTLKPSILRTVKRGGCGWHGFITNGEIITV